ncbi:hypothetical protein HDV05_002130 [Chytridiales sp. JEL 0842]|nr:hypothetical protein HDV05_002130 [Chytridiales sp. JEL 0842]
MLVYLPPNSPPTPAPPKAIMRVMDYMQRVSHLSPLSKDWFYLIRAFTLSHDRAGAVRVLESVWISLNKNGRLEKVSPQFFGAALEVHSVKIPNADTVGAETWFGRMVQAGVKPDAHKVHFLVQSYVNADDWKGAQRRLDELLNAKEVKEMDAEDSLNVALMDALDIEGPTRIIPKSKWSRFGKPDIRTYNLLIQAACESGDMVSAVKQYNNMIFQGVKPSIWTYTHLLKGFAKQQDLPGAIRVYERLQFMGLQPDIVFFTLLISVCLKSSDFAAAMRFYDEMTRDFPHVKPDTTFFNVLIDGFGKKGNLESMKARFVEMIRCKVQPDQVTLTSLMDAHVKAGQMKEAVKWLQRLTDANNSADSWTDQPESMDEVVWRESMTELSAATQENTDASNSSINTTPTFAPITPDLHTYTTLIHGYGSIQKDLHTATSWMSTLLSHPSHPLPNVHTYTALFHSFCVAGDMKSATLWFRRMLDAGIKPDAAAFHTLMDGFCQVGDMKGASSVLEEMRNAGIDPDDVTYGMLIRTHLKYGRVEEGLGLYKMMTVEKGLKPSLYILAVLVSYLGHEVGRVDAKGLPVTARREEGGLAVDERRVIKSNMSSISEPPNFISSLTPILFDPALPNLRNLTPLSPSTFQLPHTKAKHHPDLLYLYTTYRLHLPLSSRPPFLGVYDALLAHFNHLNMVRPGVETYLQCLEDGGVPDESLTVRLFKMVGRRDGWEGVLRISSAVRWRLVELVGGWKKRVREDEGKLGERGAKEADGGRAEMERRFAGSLLPVPQLGERHHEIGAEGSTDTIRPREFLHRESIQQLQKMLTMVVMASYPTSTFKKQWNELFRHQKSIQQQAHNNGLNETTQELDSIFKEVCDLKSSGTFLRYDPPSRQHFVYGRLAESQEALVGFWDKVLQIQLIFKHPNPEAVSGLERVSLDEYTHLEAGGDGEAFGCGRFRGRETKLKRIEDEAFLRFCFVYLRHCELHWFWDARRHAVQCLGHLGLKVDEKEYLKWILDHERGLKEKQQIK